MNGWCHVLIWFTSCIDLRVGGIITCLRVCPSYDIMSLFSNQCRVAIAKAIINSNVTINKKHDGIRKAYLKEERKDKQ